VGGGEGGGEGESRLGAGGVGGGGAGDAPGGEGGAHGSGGDGAEASRQLAVAALRMRPGRHLHGQPADDGEGLVEAAGVGVGEGEGETAVLEAAGGRDHGGPAGPRGRLGPGGGWGRAPSHGPIVQNRPVGSEGASVDGTTAAAHGRRRRSPEDQPSGQEPRASSMDLSSGSGQRNWS